LARLKEELLDLMRVIGMIKVKIEIASNDRGSHEEWWPHEKSKY